MTTAIEWAEDVWNPITGCTRVSEGCDHCYIERQWPFRTAGRRFDGKGPGTTTGVLLHPDRLDKPLHRRKPTRYFVNSLSDLFHEDVPPSFVQCVFDTMEATPHHEYLILTKRPGRMRAWVQSHGGLTHDHLFRAVPLPNVWLGVSVENQKWADVRIPQLLRTPAAVRFLSCEPLLGPVNLHWPPFGARGVMRYDHGIDWVIAGGESGPGYRPLNLDHARSLRDQCVKAEVPFFFKQVGGATSKSGGRLLDGRTWDEFPEAS